MSPPRRSVSGLDFSTWIRTNLNRAIRHYGKRAGPPSGSPRSPRTSASVARLRNRAHRVAATLHGYNAAVLRRNHARIKKMHKEIANYNARRRHRLVHQPNGSHSLARRNQA